MYFDTHALMCVCVCVCVCTAWAYINPILLDSPDITDIPCFILIHECPELVRATLSVLGSCSCLTLNMVSIRILIDGYKEGEGNQEQKESLHGSFVI